MFDLTAYHSSEPQPSWRPDIPDEDQLGVDAKGTVDYLDIGGPYWVVDGVVPPEACRDLVEEFDKQEAYPVGVDGYKDGSSEVGSYRAMAWAPELAAKLAPAFSMLPRVLHADGRDLTDRASLTFPTPLTVQGKLVRIGATPWMRFMRYEGGGKHVPHYDTSFESAEENYLSLFSWVLYLNDVGEDEGGGFQFVDDGHRDHMGDRPTGAFQDWTRMSEDDEVVKTVQPQAGRMLIFPHWLCHQVQAYTGSDRRHIIRGDLAYGIHSAD